MRPGRRGVVGRVLGVAQGAAELQAGLDAAITVEAAVVTFVGVARDRGVAGSLDLGPEVVRFLRAAQCADEAHYHFLASIGAVPEATEFAMPEDALGDRESFLRTLSDLEAIGVGAHMAVARRVAELGDPHLVEIAYQMGAVDAQHQALARYLAGAFPANDRAFARWRFAEPAEAGAALRGTGFLDAADELVAFPGPVDRVCRGVFGLVPETTEDALAFAGATDEAPPAATPER